MVPKFEETRTGRSWYLVHEGGIVMNKTVSLKNHVQEDHEDIFRSWSYIIQKITIHRNVLIDLYLPLYVWKYTSNCDKKEIDRRTKSNYLHKIKLF